MAATTALNSASDKGLFSPPPYFLIGGGGGQSPPFSLSLQPPLPFGAEFRRRCGNAVVGFLAFSAAFLAEVAGRWWLLGSEVTGSVVDLRRLLLTEVIPLCGVSDAAEAHLTAAGPPPRPPP
jgi:hypothetical protein